MQEVCKNREEQPSLQKSLLLFPLQFLFRKTEILISLDLYEISHITTIFCTFYTNVLSKRRTDKDNAVPVQFELCFLLFTNPLIAFVFNSNQKMTHSCWIVFSLKGRWTHLGNKATVIGIRVFPSCGDDLLPISSLLQVTKWNFTLL